MESVILRKCRHRQETALPIILILLFNIMSLLLLCACTEGAELLIPLDLCISQHLETIKTLSLWSQITNQGIQSWTQKTENAFHALPTVMLYPPDLWSVNNDCPIACKEQLGLSFAVCLSSTIGINLFESPGYCEKV